MGVCCGLRLVVYQSFYGFFSLLKKELLHGENSYNWLQKSNG
jgi:hypothetical protein